MSLATLAFTIATIWIFLHGSATPGHFFVGLIMAAFIIRFLKKSYYQDRAFFRIGSYFRYLRSFIWELFIANFQVLKIVLSPRLSIRPGIIPYKTMCKTPLGVTMLANSITLTPGTLSIDVSEDHETIFVHTLDIDHPDEVAESIREGLERPIVGAVE